MKRAWILGTLALALLALFVTWIARNTYWDYESVPAPLKGEAAINPFYAGQRLVEALGGQTERRQVLGTLPPNAVVLLAHWHWSLIEDRRLDLERWVAAGGRLVVGPTLIGGEQELQNWAGIAREHEEDDDDEVEDAETPQMTEAELGELAESGLCEQLEHDAGVARGGRNRYRICRLEPGSWLTSNRKPSWSLRNELGTQALRVAIGAGSVTMLNAAPFGNHDLTRHDHAALFVDATQLQRGDRVIFLSEEERASLLSLTWTYGAPVVVLSLLLLAIALWRYGVRFGPLAAAPDPSRRSIAEQIRGTGQFMVRFGSEALHGAMVRALQETGQRHVPGYARLSTEDRVRAIAQLSGVDADALTETINYRGPRRAGDLRNAIATLELARRRILEEKDSKRNKHAS